MWPLNLKPFQGSFRPEAMDPGVGLNQDGRRQKGSLYSAKEATARIQSVDVSPKP